MYYALISLEDDFFTIDYNSIGHSIEDSILVVQIYYGHYQEVDSKRERRGAGGWKKKEKKIVDFQHIYGALVILKEDK